MYCHNTTALKHQRRSNLSRTMAVTLWVYGSGKDISLPGSVKGSSRRHVKPGGIWCEFSRCLVKPPTGQARLPARYSRLFYFFFEIAANMGKSQSILQKHGYVIQQEDPLTVTKGDDKFLVKTINWREIPRHHVPALISEIEILKQISHPHIVSTKNSFEEQNIYYVVMDYCQERSLATEIKKKSESLQESEVLSYIVEICMALRTIHEKDVLHKGLTPENVFLTDFGIVCLGGFGKIHENSRRSPSSRQDLNLLEGIHHLAPEVFTEGTYNAKSDIWSMGCLLYELCTQEPAFSAETTIQLMPKIISGPYPSLPDQFSPDLHELLKDIFSSDPKDRPTASEILGRPFIIGCLSKKAETTVEELQTKLNELRALADGLERIHQGTTIGSLAGGVIGAVGGITSIVGLILAPFTLGASLIVTGVGIGVGALGGATAGVSNITNIVNQSTDRRAVRRIIKEIEQKIVAVVTWIQEIGNSLQTIKSRCDTQVANNSENNDLDNENVAKLGFRAGKGLGGIAELLRLVRTVHVGKVAAQTSRILRVAQVATGVLTGLFVAVDVFFIAMDAKEIHNIMQAKAVEEGSTSVPVSTPETDDSVPTFDNAQLLMPDTSESQDQSPSNTTPIRSEIMKFVKSIRQAADELQKVLNELRSICSTLPSFGDNGQLEQWNV
ncbi:hypothetical protein Q5P01_008996 [Channa striata]|uniref:non-specific serine/threonine protein kinase n=1 Tax=Channa striata TaxID=64152 RepID=A0AA88N0M3_CHASR|nr:hypothetical protein Q5P01_008996 [Channa striata]